MTADPVSKATIGRIPAYLDLLKNSPGIERGPDSHVSAAAISRFMGLGEVQVRKDLASVCGMGRPRVGYNTLDLIRRLEQFMGCANPDLVAVVGAGKLGMALLEYTGFETFGLKVVAAFDNDPAKYGKTVSGKDIYPLSDLETFCSRMGISIVIVAVPASACQEVCSLIVNSGISRILNLSPARPRLPGNVIVEQVDIALSLAHLKHGRPGN